MQKERYKQTNGRVGQICAMFALFTMCGWKRPAFCLHASSGGKHAETGKQRDIELLIHCKSDVTNQQIQRATWNLSRFLFVHVPCCRTACYYKHRTLSVTN